MPAGSPEPPHHLSTGARQEWFRLLNWMTQVHGLLSPTDHAAIGIYCSYYDQWQQAEAALPDLRKELAAADKEIRALTANIFKAKKPQRIILTAQREQLEAGRGRLTNAINVALGERNRARKEMRPYLSELGITPAARSRIRVDAGQLGLPGLGDQKPESPLEKAQRLAGA